MSAALVILGATGDLASRHLLPALSRLHDEGLLPADLEIAGVADGDIDQDRFRVLAAEAVRAAGAAGDDLEGFLGRLRFGRADVTDAAGLREALAGPARRGGPLIVYLALPHTVFEATVVALGDARLPEGSRIVVEKPFGAGTAEARRLNRRLQAVVPEERVFRVDHFLAKQTLLNVLGLRFANRVLEPIWNGLHVERVDVVWDESLALEGRAGYYDRAGALQDMLQNHLLQVLALVAMEPPASLGERDLRDRKVDVLRAVATPSKDDVATSTVRARYTAGTAGGRRIPAYVDEPGVDPGRGTETFAEVTLHVDNWRWAGVPFTLRSGKALGRDRREVRLRFRRVPHLTFGDDGGEQPNVLRLTFDPDRVSLGVNLNGAGDPFDLEPAELAADLPPHERPPYAQVLLAALAGDPVLSIRADEAEESWRIVEPVLHAWRADVAPLLEYAAGSSGPVTGR